MIVSQTTPRVLCYKRYITLPGLARLADQIDSFARALRDCSLLDGPHFFESYKLVRNTFADAIDGAESLIRAMIFIKEDEALIEIAKSAKSLLTAIDIVWYRLNDADRFKAKFDKLGKFTITALNLCRDTIRADVERCGYTVLSYKRCLTLPVLAQLADKLDSLAETIKNCCGSDGASLLNSGKLLWDAFDATRMAANRLVDAMIAIGEDEVLIEIAKAAIGLLKAIEVTCFRNSDSKLDVWRDSVTALTKFGDKIRADIWRYS